MLTSRRRTERRGAIRTNWPNLWFYGAVAICVLLIAASWVRWSLYPHWADCEEAVWLCVVVLEELNLGAENNSAAWWSGILLLLVAIHAFDGWALFRRSQRRTAFAWLLISMILVMLSLDEIGSLHERAHRLLQLGRDAALLAVERWYDFPEFGSYLGNVGLMEHFPG